MRRPAYLVLFGLAGALITAAPVRAQSVTVGTNNPHIFQCAPFSCMGGTLPVPQVLTRFQQVYSSVAFTGIGPMLIKRLTFFDTYQSGDFSDARFLFALSTTHAAVNGLSLDLDANVGADNAAFGTLLTTETGPDSSFSVLGNPFLYDPSAGNLLMDIIVTVYHEAGFYAYFDTDTSGLLSSEAYIYGQPYTTSSALVTRFDYSPAEITTIVPEPSSVALLGTGLLGLALAFWRRQRARARHQHQQWPGGPARAR